MIKHYNLNSKKEMAKKEKTTEVKIEATKSSEDYLDLTLNGKTLNCKIQQSGKIRFSFKHPAVGKIMEYEGLIEGEKLWLYPIVGEGVLSTTPINIK